LEFLLVNIGTQITPIFQSVTICCIYDPTAAYRAAAVQSVCYFNQESLTKVEKEEIAKTRKCRPAYLDKREDKTAVCSSERIN
jgi:hypothetical protein